MAEDHGQRLSALDATFLEIQSPAQFTAGWGGRPDAEVLDDLAHGLSDLRNSAEAERSRHGRVLRSPA